MPIRPEHRHHYEGPAWAATRKLILRRAQNKCECKGECGSGKHKGFTCAREDRKEHPAGHFVILTVAHLNHTPGDDRPENLRAFCQACHLGYDTELHRKNSAETRRNKKQNLELFEGEETKTPKERT